MKKYQRDPWRDWWRDFWWEWRNIGKELIHERDATGILYENGRHNVRKTPRGDFEVYLDGNVYAECVAFIGRNYTNAFERAKQECDRRAKILAEEG